MLWLMNDYLSSKLLHYNISKSSIKLVTYSLIFLVVFKTVFEVLIILNKIVINKPILNTFGSSKSFF